ncbi:3'-5' exonuclease, partial [Glaciimonas sp. Cout2]
EKAAKYRARPKAERQITLTTVAASKGQEWPHVLIPYMQENEFPRRNDKAEEKRYFYVGITRAMESLSLFEPDDKHAHLRSSLLHGAR